MNAVTRTRLIVGLSGLAVLLPAIIFGGLLAVQIIVVIVLGICVTEYANMAFPEDRAVATLWLGIGVAAAVGILTLAPAQLTPFGMVFVVLTMIFVLFRPGEDLSRAADRVGRYILGVSWISLLSHLILLRALPNGLAWCFVVLGISWLGDTGAYFSGRALGRRKLYERISPNKSVEGAVGGVITATAGVFVIAQIGLPQARALDCLVLGAVGCTVGILGDLSESMLKRAFDVKDAGSIMPGHGGMLDRIDSVLFVGVWVYAYATVVMG